MKTWLFGACCALLLSGCATSGKLSSPMTQVPQDASKPQTTPTQTQTQPQTQAEPEHEAEQGHGFVHVVLLYIPNRIFDVLDIVRARVRVGPGLAIGARVTELADFYIGSYGAVWVGIPGPRGRPEINWPFGTETKSGLELSVADETAEGGVYYGASEVGLGGQLLLVGADVGVDVFEAGDFVLGFLTIDFEHDDL